jgi:hypothetical protein
LNRPTHESFIDWMLDMTAHNIMGRSIVVAATATMACQIIGGIEVRQVASNAGGSTQTSQGGSSGGVTGGGTVSTTHTSIGGNGGSNTGALGGSSAAGGTNTTAISSATGAAAALGGTGTTGGTTATGGTFANGGTGTTVGTTATGGTSANGGSGSTGGTTATNSTNAAGGSSATGGTGAPGGSSASGGTGASGGSSSTIPIIHVIPNAATDGDGLTWATSRNSLQAAIDAAQRAGGTEVWVATGTIKASASGTMVTLRGGVVVRGGFAGTESNVAQRASTTYTTLDGNSVATHVVKASSDSTLERFIVFNGVAQGSNEDSQGALLFATSVSKARFVSVQFQGGKAIYGGCIYLQNSSVVFEAGRIGNCTAKEGGGIYATSGGTLTINSTLLEGNSAEQGGAVSLEPAYSPAAPGVSLIADRAVFLNNSTTGNSSSPTGPGGAILAVDSSVTLTEVSVVGNKSNLGTAGVQLGSGQHAVYNCLFAKNTGFGAALATDFQGGVGDRLDVVHSTFAYNDYTGCPGNCDLVGPTDSRGIAINSIFVSNDKSGASSPQIGSQPGSCSLFVAGGLGQKPTPFDEPLTDADGDKIPEYFLKQDATDPCFNVGVTSTATYPQLANVNYATMTTSGTGCTDANAPDAGRHYAPWAASPAVCSL